MRRILDVKGRPPHQTRQASKPRIPSLTPVVMQDSIPGFPYKPEVDLPWATVSAATFSPIPDPTQEGIIDVVGESAPVDPIPHIRLDAEVNVRAPAAPWAPPSMEGSDIPYEVPAPPRRAPSIPPATPHLTRQVATGGGGMLLVGFVAAAAGLYFLLRNRNK